MYSLDSLSPIPYLSNGHRSSTPFIIPLRRKPCLCILHDVQLLVFFVVDELLHCALTNDVCHPLHLRKERETGRRKFCTTRRDCYHTLYSKLCLASNCQLIRRSSSRRLCCCGKSALCIPCSLVDFELWEIIGVYFICSR